ncbi:hypothetical protein [Streptomyces sp. NPDC048603]|uniref:hypothetical protein n=1 Tax=Streptomyces sp. NPDC048603 TaxID=3365577 RepID=UPI0037131185
MIRRPAHGPAIAVLLAGSLALAACGTTKAGAGAGASGSATPDYVRQAQASAEAGKQAHDRKFPDIAARCKDAAAAPSASGSPGASSAAEPLDPEAAKYAENHAYKTQARLSPEAGCRGGAHAARITKGLVGTGKTAPTTEDGLRKALEALGYPATEDEVFTSGGALGFAFSVPGAGPCVTGYLGTPPKVEAHGQYMEGGCMEPRGGH